MDDYLRLFGTAVLGGLVSLLLATLIYRWQKRFDRQTEHRGYLRTVYADFARVALELSEVVTTASPDEHKDGIWQHHPLAKEMRQLYQRIHLYAPEAERDAANNLSMCCGGFLVEHRRAALGEPDAPTAEELVQYGRDVMTAFEGFVGTVRQQQRRHLGG